MTRPVARLMQEEDGTVTILLSLEEAAYIGRRLAEVLDPEEFETLLMALDTDLVPVLSSGV